MCGLLSFSAAVSFSACTPTTANENAEPQDNTPKVYFTKEITPESLVRIYDALGVTIPENARVAVKISTGESKHTNHLRPDFIAPLLSHVNGRIVECNPLTEATAATRLTTCVPSRNAAM